MRGFAGCSTAVTTFPSEQSTVFPFFDQHAIDDGTGVAVSNVRSATSSVVT